MCIHVQCLYMCHVHSCLLSLPSVLELKKEARIAADLPPTFPENHPTRPLIFPTPNHDPQGQGGATGAAAAMATTGAGGGATAESKKLDQMLAHTAKSNGEGVKV